MILVVGIDIGSTYTKAVMMDETKECASNCHSSQRL